MKFVSIVCGIFAILFCIAARLDQIRVPSLLMCILFIGIGLWFWTNRKEQN